MCTSAGAQSGTAGRLSDALLAEMAERLEGVWRDRAGLRDEVERLEGELTR